MEQDSKAIPETKQQQNQNESIIAYDDFDSLEGNAQSWFGIQCDKIPFEVIPAIYYDNRGSYSVLLKTDVDPRHGEAKYNIANIISKTHQVSRSLSNPGVCRGFHAQSGSKCQSKYVECLSPDTPIWDLIIDMRPDSNSFQQFHLFKLSGTKMNKIWIPRGFLHCMIASKYDLDEQTNTFTECNKPAILQYFVDNDYDPKTEICINPETILPYLINMYYKDFEQDHDKNKSLVPLFKTIQDGLTMSPKDKTGRSYLEFASEVDADWKTKHRLWYK